MQHLPAWQALTTFGVAERRSFTNSQSAEGADEREVSVAPLLEEAKEEAYARGRADAEAELCQKIEFAHEEFKRGCEHELASRVEAKVREFQSVSQKLDVVLAALADALFAKVAAILAPVLDEAAGRQVAEELRETVRSLQDNPDAGAIRVMGPSRLIESIGIKDHPRICVVEDESMTDVVIAADDTRVQSELSRWQSRLREKLT